MESKKRRVAILVSDKTDFKPTKFKRDKGGHYIMVKGSMQQEELTILNIYAHNTGAPSYIKQDFKVLIVGDVYTPNLIKGIQIKRDKVKMSLFADYTFNISQINKTEN